MNYQKIGLGLAAALALALFCTIGIPKIARAVADSVAISQLQDQSMDVGYSYDVGIRQLFKR